MYWTKQPWILSVELWVVNIVHSQEVDASCCANSGREEGYQQVLCHGDFEELSVERGKCLVWQETLKSAELCQRGSQDYTLPPKHKTLPDAASQIVLM